MGFPEKVLIPVPILHPAGSALSLPLSIYKYTVDMYACLDMLPCHDIWAGILS